MKKIFAMVDTTKSRKYTYTALKSFFKNTPLDESDRFLLIDNDGAFPADYALPTKIEFLSNPNPLSFAENVNAALSIALSGGCDLVFLNNDVVFTENWSTPLFLRNDTLLVPNCNQLIQGYFGKFRISKYMDISDYEGNEQNVADFAKLLVSNPSFSGKTVAPRHIGFFCFHLPYPVAARVGKFDERFGRGGGEDVDYRIRALALGIDVEIALDSFVLHFGGKSTWRGGESQRETMERNFKYESAFIEKWGETLASIFLWPDAIREAAYDPIILQALQKKDYASVIRFCAEEMTCPPGQPYLIGPV